jgi:hypothetical protein
MQGIQTMYQGLCALYSGSIKLGRMQEVVVMVVVIVR